MYVQKCVHVCVCVVEVSECGNVGVCVCMEACYVVYMGGMWRCVYVEGCIYGVGQARLCLMKVNLIHIGCHGFTRIASPP